MDLHMRLPDLRPRQRPSENNRPNDNDQTSTPVSWANRAQVDIHLDAAGGRAASVRLGVPLGAAPERSRSAAPPLQAIRDVRIGTIWEAFSPPGRVPRSDKSRSWPG